MKKIYFVILRIINVIFGILSISIKVFLRLRKKGYELYNINHLYKYKTFVLRDTGGTNGFIFFNKIQIKELLKEFG